MPDGVNDILLPATNFMSWVPEPAPLSVNRSNTSALLSTQEVAYSF